LAALREEGNVSDEVASPSSMMRDWRSVSRQTESFLASGFDRNLNIGRIVSVVREKFNSKIHTKR